jgi:hypothetical protein
MKRAKRLKRKQLLAKKLRDVAQLHAPPEADDRTAGE